MEFSNESEMQSPGKEMVVSLESARPVVAPLEQVTDTERGTLEPLLS